MGNKATIRQARYDSTHTVSMKFKFNINTDADIIHKLESVANRQGYIKHLIRKDISESYQRAVVPSEDADL